MPVRRLTYVSLCRLFSDYCEEAGKVTTKGFEVAKCVNGMCITECDVCDGQFLDCSDFSDELNCSGQGPDPERCAIYNQFKRAIRVPDF